MFYQNELVTDWTDWMRETLICSHFMSSVNILQVNGISTV